jgi:FkbM family methyltransferase
MPAEVLKNLIRYTVPRPVRNSLRSPSKSIEWIWDSARFGLGVTKTLRFPPDICIALHPHAFKVAHKAQVNDPEQSAEFRNFISHCNSGMFLFDIGAHFGLFSLAAVQLNAKAVAVDPSAIAIRMIYRQTVLNHATQKIRVLQAAVSDTDGVVEMLSSGVFSEGYFRFATGRPSRELTQIRSVTIDQMMSDFGAPTHIKIDVEGHEAAVLRGGRETLMRFSPGLFLELHNQMVAAAGGDPNSALDELKNVGYETFAFDGTPIDRNVIFRKPITRVVARRVVQAI